MDKRYYVMAVQHNKEKNAENRTVPSAFDDRKQALQKFHEVLGNDMKNATLDWSVVYLLSNHGGIEQWERWEDPEPEPAEEPTE